MISQCDAISLLIKISGRVDGHNQNRRQFENIFLANITRIHHLVFWNTWLLNVLANLIALFMKYFL